MDCTACNVTECRPTACAKGEAVADPVRDEQILADDPDDPRLDSPIKNGNSGDGLVQSMPSNAARSGVDLLSGRIEDLSDLGVSPSGVVTLKHFPLERQEELRMVKESALRNLPLSPSDLTIVLAVQERVQKQSGMSKSSATTAASSKYAAAQKAEVEAEKEIAFMADPAPKSGNGVIEPRMVDLMPKSPESAPFSTGLKSADNRP